MCRKFNWSGKSKMPSVYQHPDQDDLTKKIKEYWGVSPEISKVQLQPITCPWCRTVNSPMARFCAKCNTPLNSENARKTAKVQKKRMEVVDKFIRRVSEGIAPEDALRELKDRTEALA